MDYWCEFCQTWRYSKMELLTHRCRPLKDDPDFVPVEIQHD